jgi:hypothetical protein
MVVNMQRLERCRAPRGVLGGKVVGVLDGGGDYLNWKGDAGARVKTRHHPEKSPSSPNCIIIFTMEVTYSTAWDLCESYLIMKIVEEKTRWASLFSCRIIKPQFQTFSS